jgi:predicted component of type VI protein secretion system
MPLILTVSGLPDGQDSTPARMIFGPGGGRIGRGKSNDWVLPDMHRYLSSHHARICCIDGEYYVDDLSSNGTYLNDTPEPLGDHRSPALRPGDRLRMGSYRFAVDFIADISTENLQRVSGQPAEEVFIDHSVRLPQMAVAGDTPPERRNGPPRQGAFERGELDAFCRGAGIDLASLGSEIPTGLLYIAGLMLREALVGVREMTESQRTLRTASQLPAPVPGPRDAQMQRSSVEELMRMVLTAERSEALESVHWLRDQFAQARRHDQAMASAMRSALAEFLRRLEPQALGEGGSAQTRFRSLTECDAGGLPVLFMEALARHFTTEIRPAQQGSSGSRSAA